MTYAAWEGDGLVMFGCLSGCCLFNKKLPPQTKMICFLKEFWEDGCLTFFLQIYHIKWSCTLG